MSSHDENGIPFTTPRQSATFTADVNSDIRRAAATGIYDIRGGGAKRKYQILMIYFLWAHLFLGIH